MARNRHHVRAQIKLDMALHEYLNSQLNKLTTTLNAILLLSCY